jgi:hypothetical protein
MRSMDAMFRYEIPHFKIQSTFESLNGEVFVRPVDHSRISIRNLSGTTLLELRVRLRKPMTVLTKTFDLLHPESMLQSVDSPGIISGLPHQSDCEACLLM